MTTALNVTQPHSLAATELVTQLESNLETGLSTAQVQARLEHCGPNEIKAKAGISAWQRFFVQFKQPLILILLVAGVIKALLNSWVNAGVILSVTVINAIIGYLQEAKAEEAIAALAQSVATETMVLRNGEQINVPSQGLVPGDVVLLASGDRVPADLRLLVVRNLQVDEAALTGESVPIPKQAIEQLAADTALAERRNMAYAGSFVTFGQATGVVIATGTNTETGRISRLIESSGGLETPLTRKFAAFSQVLLYGILVLAALTFGVGLWRGQSAIAMFEAAIALAVSAIPEGLPAVVTVTLAIGVARMAERNAIIRKLPAVEALGSATVICSDKTGTLTENQMTVQSIFAAQQTYNVSGVGYQPLGEIQPQDDNVALKTCLAVGFYCNDTNLRHPDANPDLNDIEVVGDPTEAALVVVAQKAGLRDRKQQVRLDAIPFESEYQYMATLNQISSAPVGSQNVIYVKGSVEALLQRCVNQMTATGGAEPLRYSSILQQVDHMASQGLRVLAFAIKEADQGSLSHDDVSSGLTFVGLQGMIDPPREAVIAAVQDCQVAGIQVKMITGDHVTTALAIAKQIGLKNPQGEVKAYSGRDLELMPDAALKQAVLAGSVFARVVPEQKLRLVEALQAQQHVVAMTGDGVNDAPALKQADVGIAMGKHGTEVAKGAADMLLTDDNFASIAAAVEEGRTVYQNLIKAIAFILPVNGGESMTILLSVLLNRELPILALQVLWLNMLNSITMTVPLAFEPPTGREMRQPPRNPRANLLSPKLLQRILVVSLFNWILIFGVFEYVNQTTGDSALARTMAIQALVMGRIIYLLSLSQALPSLWRHVKRKDARSQEESLEDSVAIASGIGVAVGLQILFSQWGILNALFQTAPLSLGQWGICIALGLPMIIVSVIANRVDPA